MAKRQTQAIGIVGGGQLALMLAEAAADLGIALHVQTPRAEDPAASRASGVVLAPLDDVAATRELASRCGAISFENEWIPLERLEALRAEKVRFLPDLETLRPLVSKRSQRELLNRLHLPCPRWCPLEETLGTPPLSDDTQPDEPWLGEGPAAATQPRLPDGMVFPVMAKAVRGGYDGRGTLPLPDQAALEALLEREDPADWILEEMVAFESELAMVICRDSGGTVACFPLVQTHQRRQVCDWVLFGIPMSHAVEAFARNVAVSLVTALEYVGVLSIEFFYGPAGLQVNEIAPRTHNSGHYTIEACRNSQFSQQVRIVSGLPMGLVDPLVPGALMVNLLAQGKQTGQLDQETRLRDLQRLPGAHLHWYGKTGGASGRKLGHLTLLLEGASPSERQVEAERLLAQARSLWPLPPDGPEPLE